MKLRIGCQLYVWSQVLAKESKKIESELAHVLDEVAASGYEGFEGSLGFANTTAKAKAFAQLCQKHVLACESLYSGGNFCDSAKADTAINTIVDGALAAHLFGVTAITCNPDPIGREKTDTELKIQATNVQRCGEALRKLGVRLHIHYHSPEMKNDAREFHHLMANTDPAVVRICMDVHWTYRGSQDPIAMLKRYVKRVRSLHIRQSRNGIWTEDLCDGDVDYRQVHDILAEAEFNGWLNVELAYEKGTVITRPLVEDMKRSREYMRTVFGV